jgi:hypothetical protein
MVLFRKAHGKGPANTIPSHSNGSAKSITIDRAGTIALRNSKKTDETGHEFLQIFHR